MTGAKPEIQFETWTVPETDLSIEYSAGTLEEIRLYCIDGLRRISRGGVEVGGVLFGARGDNTVRLLTWRPIHCEHSHGPPLQLSQDDRMALGRFLQQSKTDPELEGLHALGWFVSHTKTEVCLTESDAKIFDHFFPWSWQVTLVLRPGRDGVAQAGFFFRDREGNIKQDASYREFVIGPLGSALTSGARDRDVNQSSAAEEANGEELSPLFSPRRYTPPPERKSGMFNDRRSWIWAVPVLLALIIAAMFLDRPADRNPPSIAFRVVDNGGDLKLEWDKNSQAVRDAVRGTLQIKDGTSTVQLPLAAERLREGTFTYARKTGDLELSITVYPVNGTPVQESARFVGPSQVAATNTDNATQIRRDRDNLAGEVDRLRAALRKEQNRTRELEDTVRILENRVQVEQFHRPPQNPEPNK